MFIRNFDFKYFSLSWIENFNLNFIDVIFISRSNKLGLQFINCYFQDVLTSLQFIDNSFTSLTFIDTLMINLVSKSNYLIMTSHQSIIFEHSFTLNTSTGFLSAVNSSLIINQSNFSNFGYIISPSFLSFITITESFQIADFIIENSTFMGFSTENNGSVL